MGRHLCLTYTCCVDEEMSVWGPRRELDPRHCGLGDFPKPVGTEGMGACFQRTIPGYRAPEV